MPHTASQKFLRELDKKLWTEKNVFWVPALARGKTLQDSAKLPAGTEILKGRGHLARSYKITSTGKLMMHLGYVIKAEEILVASRAFEALLRTQGNI